MKRWMKIVFCVGFSFLFCVMCVGYAQLSDTLSIAGMADIHEPHEVYISRIISTTGTVHRAQEILNTTIDSSISLGSGASDIVTMTVEVKNNTSVKYGFNAIRYTGEAYSNAGIAVTTDMRRKTVDNRGNLTDEGTVLEPGQTITFVATFSYLDGKVGSPDLTSLINYEFLPWEHITADTDVGLASDVMGRFLEILNNIAAPDSYQQLLDQMAKSEEADRIYDDYIANFDEAYVVDKEVLTSLFGNDMLFVNLNGEEVEVKVMIKQKNVTSDYAGDEMVLYMTTHSLKRADGDRDGLWSYYASPVYAAVFANSTVNNKSEWIRIGDMYHGEGRINGYDGNRFGEGSFDTETWRSTQAYGTAGVGSSINTVIERNT